MQSPVESVTAHIIGVYVHTFLLYLLPRVHLLSHTISLNFTDNAKLFVKRACGAGTVT